MTPDTMSTERKLTVSAFQRYRGLGVWDSVMVTKYYSAQKVSVVIFPVLRYQLSSDLQNYFRSRCTGLYVGLYAQHSATIKKTLRNHGRRDGNRTKRRHACPPTPPARRSSCTCAWRRGWPKLAARERRDSRRGGRNSAAPRRIFRATTRGSWTSPLNRRGR